MPRRINLTWPASADEGGNFTQYRAQVSKDNAFGTGVFEKTTAAGVLTALFTEDELGEALDDSSDSWYGRVRAEGATLNSAWVTASLEEAGGGTDNAPEAPSNLVLTEL